MSWRIPILRHGAVYESLDTQPLIDHRTGEVLATMSIANAGIIRRDARRAGAHHAALRQHTCAELIAACRRAADSFLNDTLPLDEEHTQSPQEYVQSLSATSGLPHTLVRRNMEKIRFVLAEMATIIQGLTRGLDLAAIDTGCGSQAGVPVSYFPMAASLGVVLPNNSPGVNSIWLPAIAMKMPVVLKPGSAEPWTPLRIIRALVSAGVPAEAFGFYPAEHDGTDAVMQHCDRRIIFGDDRTLSRYANDPTVQTHGTGRSKIILGEDVVDRWADYLDVMVESICANGGRSCINVSSVIAPRHGRAIAQALADRLGAIEPRAMDDPQAELAAFANPAVADAIDQMIGSQLDAAGAVQLTPTPRRVECGGSAFLRPTVVWCDSFDHVLANTEFLFPFVAVTELPQAEMLSRIGPTLAAMVITNDAAFRDQAMRCAAIDRLHLGPSPTTHVQWDQPHEGNLFEFLYRRRAVQQVQA